MNNYACSPMLLTQAEVAARLKVSQRQIRRMVAQGHFPPPLKVGGQNRWSEAIFIGYIAELEQLAGCGKLVVGA